MKITQKATSVAMLVCVVSSMLANTLTRKRTRLWKFIPTKRETLLN